MAELPPPVLLAVVPARHLSRDPSSLRFSLGEIVTYLGLPTIPFTVPQLSAYIAVTSVRRPLSVGVELVSPGGDVIGSLSWPLVPSDPLFVHECGSTMHGIQFATAGTFRIRATADGDMLGEWGILVGAPGHSP